MVLRARSKTGAYTTKARRSSMEECRAVIMTLLKMHHKATQPLLSKVHDRVRSSRLPIIQGAQRRAEQCDCYRSRCSSVGAIAAQGAALSMYHGAAGLPPALQCTTVGVPTTEHRVAPPPLSKMQTNMSAVQHGAQSSTQWCSCHLSVPCRMRSDACMGHGVR